MFRRYLKFRINLGWWLVMVVLLWAAVLCLAGGVWLGGAGCLALLILMWAYRPRFDRADPH